MKIFLDTANLEELRNGAGWGILDGVSTNPTLIARQGKPFEEQIRRICEIVNGDVSAEVVATEADQMIEQGRELARIHPNVVVEVSRDAGRHPGHGGAGERGPAGERDAVRFAGPGAAGRQGRGLHRQPVRGPARRHRSAENGSGARHPRHLPELRVQDAGSGRLAALAAVRGGSRDTLFNHPLTDKGLDQFLKDYRKVYQGTSLEE